MSFMVAAIQDQTYSVEINEDEATRKVVLDGQGYIIDWKQIAPLAKDEKKHAAVGGRYSLLLAGRSYEVFARSITRPAEKNSHVYEIHINGQRFEVAVADEQARTLAGFIEGSARSSAATIYAPMPGLVVGILLEPGAEVKAGEPVIILEAMKMENDLSAPIHGKIREIAVQKGQTVDLGAVLVLIDGSAET